MKYIRGDQDYALEDLELTKIRLTDGDDMPEGIWVKQADDHVILQNNALAFYPFRSWGLILPSNGGAGEYREDIDVASIKEGPMELTVHPEAWDSMLKKGVIDEEGMFIPPPDREGAEAQVEGGAAS
jgi:hypothetical protein